MSHCSTVLAVVLRYDVDDMVTRARAQASDVIKLPPS